MNNLPAPLQFIVNSNLWISIGALAATLQTVILVQGELAYHPIYALIFGATMLVYIGQRMLPLLLNKGKQDTYMAQWMERNTFVLYFALILSVSIIFYGLWFIQYKVVIILGLLGLASVGYAVPLIKFNGQSLRLRDWGLIKPFLLGLIWALVTVTLPLLQFGSNVFETANMALFAERFFFITAICIPFDIKDMHHDKTDIAQHTLPLKYGTATAINIARKLLLLFLIVAICNCLLWLKVGPAVWLAYLISFVLSLTLLYRCREDSTEYYYTFLIDGTIIIQAVLVIGATLLNFQ